ncbi:MAG: alpha/beta hydrolase [Halioglobus sp.]|nr:alpha/beta hydrolase [Halioglobus sp.]
MRGSDGTPLGWQVNGLHLAGLAWGEQGQRPVLALHGWLDNAASFTLLAPRLTGCHVVALDLTGHGRSDHRSADASYQIWDDLPEILGVMDALGWEQCDVIGHSRGAIIAGLLAAAFPERVAHLVMLDAVSPEAIADEDVVVQLRRALLDKQRLGAREAKIFASVEEAVQSRASRGLPPAAARLLVMRNQRRCKGGVTWTTDARLHGASAVKLTGVQIRAVLEALTMPVLLLLAADTRAEYQEYLAEHARSHIRDIRIRRITGGHHFHMEKGAADAAQAINKFLGIEREVT